MSNKYLPPTRFSQIPLLELLKDIKRNVTDTKQLDLLKQEKSSVQKVLLYYAGDLSLLKSPSVAIVGAREVSSNGYLRAHKLARQLSEANITVVSGLAKGVDTAALTGSLKAKGRVVGVIGTPLNKAYPAENKHLQENIWKNELLISPFEENSRVFRGNFPKRNKVMAAISDATVIVEASDTSGTLHQASECQRLNRWLFILKSVFENTQLEWPTKFQKYEKTVVLEDIQQILDKVGVK